MEEFLRNIALGVSTSEIIKTTDNIALILKYIDNNKLEKEKLSLNKAKRIGNFFVEINKLIKEFMKGEAITNENKVD